MKIIKLTAENVKRLKAVEITPDGTVQVITGRNAQGKTSVLDAIWLALGGGAASRETAQPIRAGEVKASVTLDLGDLVVTRTWTGEKTALTVKSADGAKYSSPQSVLDALVGRLSFDPLEFTRLSGREQLSALLELVQLDVNLDDLSADRQLLYTDRTEIGRKGKALEGQAAGLGPLEDAPAEEVSASDLIARIRGAQQREQEQADDRREVQRWTEEVAEAQRQLTHARMMLADVQALVSTHRAVEDVDALERNLASVEETNRAVRRNAERRTVDERLAAVRSAYAAATEAIDEIDRTKADALAKATFPVPGLGFDDAGVTYNDVPFSQASAAEQIRVSLAMAMSLNPTLRVIRILDGSLLDADNLRLISEMAAERDYQLWIERVADGSGVGVVIEDGEVAA
ncbi:AAA family ATPase [Blastococcus sp. CT_GayMR16]|uniref:AAA family ATPase n=1 Tax=Blastococcus sp. CT_GayMR16 TaxID=2559607 RepID=UPI001072F0D0|nr:AAA family ATPase [Blastococcus sp. CT_GayMR16]TFV91376.1 hypothetical protein E4P38_01965 [Blastococcus sp. CT_GayMR16]